MSVVYGLMDKWDESPVLRQRARNQHCLMQWTSEDQVGIPNKENLLLNVDVLLAAAKHVPGGSPSLQLIEAEAWIMNMVMCGHA